MMRRDEVPVLGQLSDWVIQVVESLGYVGVALMVAFETLFPPIPSELVLGLAGFVASRGEASLLGMIVAATTGSVIGAWTLYGIAAIVGPARVRALVRRYGRWVRITEADVDTAERWFARWSTLAVLIGRCVPLVRSLISIPAGFARMNIVSFTIYTTIGSLIWNAIFVVAGYMLGERWETATAYADYFQLAVIVAIVCGLTYLVVFLVRRRAI